MNEARRNDFMAGKSGGLKGLVLPDLHGIFGCTLRRHDRVPTHHGIKQGIDDVYELPMPDIDKSDADVDLRIPMDKHHSLIRNSS